MGANTITQLDEGEPTLQQDFVLRLMKTSKEKNEEELGDKLNELLLEGNELIKKLGEDDLNEFKELLLRLNQKIYPNLKDITSKLLGIIETKIATIEIGDKTKKIVASDKTEQ